MPPKRRPKTNGIGTLSEGPLHAALKAWCAQPGDTFETMVDGFVVDIVRGELLVEIETGNFARLKRKLRLLTERHPVRLVHPIACNRWIVRVEDGEETSRRKSPKHGRIEHIFEQLVSIPSQFAHPSLSVEVLFTEEEVVRCYDPARRACRKGWVASERRLLRVTDHHLLATPADLAALLPPDLPHPFTTADLAEASGIRRRLAQRMAYCLRALGLLADVGKCGNARLHARVGPKTQPRATVPHGTRAEG